MDDLQFRRAIYADPNNQDADVILAQQKDASKKQFAQEMSQLDEKIKQALQVPVPDDLCNRLILRQSLTNHQVQKRRKRVYVALASSVMLVAALLVNVMQFSNAYNNLGDYALAHVYHEQNKFVNNSDSDGNNAISLASLNQKMTAFNGSFTQSLGKLLFADYCRFGGLKSLHLVYQGKTSPVTIFVVAKNEQLTFTKAFNDQQFFGNAMQFSNSNIIVVADKNESLAQWQQHINETVSWSI